MLRKLHGLPGLAAAVLLVVIAVSGAVLAIAPALERSAAVIPATGELSVAGLAERVAANYPGIEQIERTSSGSIIAYYSHDGQAGAELVNPVTGQGIETYQPPVFFRWVRDLHRAFLLGDGGRMTAGLMAVLMGVICLSGIMLQVRRSGSWRGLLRPMSGSGWGRVHAELARLAAVGLLLSALTGTYLSAVRFGLLPEMSSEEPSFPAAVSGGQHAPVGSLAALQALDLSELQSLVFPFPADPNDAYSLQTIHGSGFVDPSTGALLEFQPVSAGSSFHQWMVKLHTGEGLWWFALILGVAAVTVPGLAVTGMRVWWLSRQSFPDACENVEANQADTVILVGSEGNTTWGFARNLQASLARSGRQVHCSPMNGLASDYPRASTMLVLTSTYGDGDAPASASDFLARLDHFRNSREMAFAVLGFGDRKFARFCQFALEVDTALQARGLRQLLPIERIDCGSAAGFRAWGESLGEQLGTSLTLTHCPNPPVVFPMELVERVDYGVAVGAPTSILRFRKIPAVRGRGMLRARLPASDYEAGDLLGVLPPDGSSPRLYSLASSAADGLVEICVRKQTGGLCSGYLHGLQPGDRIAGYIQRNTGFRPAGGAVPVILVGAGAGIGPLAGFIRKNTDRNPMYLYWGGRNPDSDFLYRPELSCYLEDQRLTGLSTAFSRSAAGAYVQDKIIEDQAALRQLVAIGAQILVCGGRDMATGVKQVFDAMLQPMNLDVAMLKAQGRYLEDVY